MKLYYSPGACSLAPHIALREAERPFTLERVDLKTHRTETGRDYYEINPKGYVPALAIDDLGNEILTENVAVLQYIADLAPDSRLAPPYGTFLRYHLQEWLGFITSEIHKPFGWLWAPDTPSHTQARARGKLGDRLTYLNGVLSDRGYLMGETFTVADAYMVPMLRWLDRIDVDRLVWPNIESYYQRLIARPHVHAALLAEGLLEHHHLRRTA